MLFRSSSCLLTLPERFSLPKLGADVTSHWGSQAPAPRLSGLGLNCSYLILMSKVPEKLAWLTMPVLQVEKGEAESISGSGQGHRATSHGGTRAKGLSVVTAF